MNVTPADRHAAIDVSSGRMRSIRDISNSTCLPAAAAAATMVCGEPHGRRMTTASNASALSRSKSSKLVARNGTPSASAVRWANAPSGSTTAASCAPCSRDTTSP